MSHRNNVAYFGRPVIFAAALVASACGGESATTREYASQPATFNPDFVVTPEEAYAWAKAKHDNSPALTGSPEWHGWLQDLERRF